MHFVGARKRELERIVLLSAVHHAVDEPRHSRLRFAGEHRRMCGVLAARQSPEDGGIGGVHPIIVGLRPQASGLV